MVDSDETREKRLNAADGRSQRPRLGGTATPENEFDEQDFLLLIRFLVGLVALGSSELMNRLREPQTVTARVEPGMQATYDDFDDEELRTKRMYHVLMGTIVRSQLWTFRRMARSLRTTMGIGAWAFHAADRLTATPLLRPVRWPFEVALEQLERQVQMSIRMGRAIELGSSDVAYDTVKVFTDQVIHYLSQNPELAALVRTQIEQQSVGFADTFVGNGRLLSAQADDSIESIIRRFLGRGAAKNSATKQQ